MYYLLFRSPKTDVYDLLNTFPDLESVYKAVASNALLKYKVIHCDDATGKFTSLDDL